ncbi:MAG: VOC family protein [Gemmatimonadaceae bacterium]
MTGETTTTTAAGIAPPGYRLPAATRLGRVVLQVSDLARSLDYYERVLGFRTLERDTVRATLGAHDGGDAPPLVELRERRGIAAVPRRGLLGLFHFAVLLPAREDLGRFLAHLAQLGTQTGMSDHLVSEAIYLTDPDGLGIEVYADRPRSAWRYEGGQIAMTTIALDARDLLRAGGATPWSGMPAGTTIGHVHLHVGDLERAEAFYHDALGFDKVVWGYPGALFLSAGGYHHHLGTNTWAAGAPSASDDDARLVEWEIVMPSEGDAAAAAESLAGAGYAVTPAGAQWLVADPWGTTVRIRCAA